jgi:hypothetical protein
MSLLEKVNQLPDNTAVAAVEERSGDTSVTRTTGTTNAVNVVINIGGEIIVNDVGDVWNIKTTSSDSSSNQNRATSGAEHLQSTLTFTLGAVTVDSSCREALVQQEVGQSIRHTLGLHEDESETARAMSVKDIKKDGTLVVVLDILNFLSDVLRGRADTTNREENVILQEVPGKHLNIARESGREHQSLAVIDARHVFALYDAANLRLETHVQHTISLIENQVLDVNQRDAATLDQVNQTTRGSDKEIAATLDLTELRANIGTTVDDTGANPRAVSEFAGFVKDLRNKLTSGSEDQGSRVRLALTAVAELTRGLSRYGGRTCLESLGENGEQETTSLSGTSLSAGHEIATTHHDGNGVLLDGSRGLVVSELNVGNQVVIQRRVREGIDGLGDVVTRCFDGDVVVVGEVNTSALLGGIVGNTEKLTLQAGVCGTGDVLAIAPLAVSRAFGRTALRAAVGASVSWVSVSMWIKGPTLGFRGSPAVVTIGDIGTTRAEIRGVGISPVATARTASVRSMPRSAKMNTDKELVKT